jgi:hypothetical protein
MPTVKVREPSRPEDVRFARSRAVVAPYELALDELSQ